MNTENSQKSKHESLTYGLAITGLVIGILTLIISFIPCLGAFAIYIGGLGLLISLITLGIAFKHNHNKGLIIAALITSLLGCSIAYWQAYRMKNAIESTIENFEEFNEKSAKEINEAKEEFIQEMKDEQEEFIEEIKETNDEIDQLMSDINEDSIQETQKSQEENYTKTLVITVDNLRVRTSPNLDAEKIENLPINTLVEYLDEQSNEKTVVEIKGAEIDEYWYKIKTPSGKIGWIHGCCFMIK